MKIRWIIGGMAVLLGAYVCGRAVGILLNVNPYATEGVAIVLVLTAASWALARRGR